MVVPTAPLHAVPWPSLPSLASVAVEVAPSSAWWCQRPAPPAAGEIALVAGPGLPGAASEVGELTARYPGARVLTGAAATVEATTRALDGASMAHLACHGRFRAENPLFSALELADGSLTVYDLERLTRAPAVVVLSACDSGVSAVRPGDELLGLLSSLFALGTDAVVASAVPVPDLDTTALMLAFHDALGHACDRRGGARRGSRRRRPDVAHRVRRPDGLRLLRPVVSAGTGTVAAMASDMIFGAFLPQGWKMELSSIDGAEAKWAKAVEIAVLAEELGYDSIWVYDHFHNVPRPAHEAVFECWTTMAAISQRTSRIRLGQMVGCNSYRKPSAAGEDHLDRST